MDWIVDGIALGGWQDYRDHHYLELSGIRAVLRLYGPGEPEEFPFAEEVLQLYVLDGRALPEAPLREGVEFIRWQRQQGRPLLVCCGRGVSRSPTFVAAYLHEEGADLLEAYQTIQSQRREILPHPELLRSLVQHYGLSTPSEELLVTLVKTRKRLREGE